jgi:hypothetical protein
VYTVEDMEIIGLSMLNLVSVRLETQADATRRFMFPNVAFRMAGGSHTLKEMARTGQEDTGYKVHNVSKFPFYR